MSPNVFEINEVNIRRNKCCGEFYAVFFLVTIKKKMQDQSKFSRTSRS